MVVSEEKQWRKKIKILIEEKEILGKPQSQRKSDLIQQVLYFVHYIAPIMGQTLRNICII